MVLWDVLFDIMYNVHCISVAAEGGGAKEGTCPQPALDSILRSAQMR